MANKHFEEWWSAHYSDQPEAAKLIASEAFEAGMDRADQMHRTIREFIRGDYTGTGQPAVPVGITMLS